MSSGSKIVDNKAVIYQTMSADGSTIIGAKAMFGFYALSQDQNVIDGGETDPIAEEWEKKALCILGRDYSGGRDKAYANCKSDELLAFRPNFQRSFGDEFGAAVRGDVAKLGSSYMAILAFMFVMLSRKDSVHSMIFMGTYKSDAVSKCSCNYR